MTSATAFSSGKVIISGEHAVVAGQPALVSSINLGLNIELRPRSLAAEMKTDDKFDEYSAHVVNLLSKQINKEILLDKCDIFVDSNLPQSTGLGSSAAYAHALILALAELLGINLSEDEIFNLVWQAEHFKHGQSSGLDPAAVVFGGLQTFQNSDGKILKNQIKTHVLDNKQFWLINSGSVTESRKDLILGVQARVSINSRLKQVIKRIGEIGQLHVHSLKKDTFNHELMTENQRLLEELEVVGDIAKEMVRDIEKMGGVAKIIGSGGVKTGSGFLLAYHPDSEILATLIKNKNWSVQPITLGN